MIKNILLLIIFISAQTSLGEKGYVLHNLIFYHNDLELRCYNLIDGPENQLLIATDQGIYILNEGGVSSAVDKLKGWAKFNFLTNTFEASTKYELIESGKYLTFATAGRYLYKVIDGKLVVYTKTYYNKYLENESVRAISSNYIATYGGIYTFEFDSLVNYPNYSSGKIRRFNNKTFVVYDGLFYEEDGQPHYFTSAIGQIQIGGQSIGYGVDILALNEDQYLLFTSKGIWKTDFTNLELIDVSIKSERSSTTKFIHKYPNDGRILYLMDDSLKLLGKDLNPETLLTFKEEVEDVVINEMNEDLYFIDKKIVGLIRNSKIQKITDNTEKFHSILPLENILVLTSNNGLFKLDLNNLKQIKFISDEFNKTSLEFIKDSIWAGSVSGLYSISLEDFEDYTELNSKAKAINSIYWFFGAILGVLLTIIATLVFRLKKRTPLGLSEDITRESILNYINDNLKIVTLASIQREFKVSYRRLSKILGESPGKTIEKERKKILYSRTNKNKSMVELSAITGYSVPYLKKIYGSNKHSY